MTILAIRAERADALGLPLQSEHPVGPAFTVSVEADKGVSTGISAFDRAVTVATVIDSEAGPDDVVSPGHVFPVVADDQGVLGRRSFAEAGMDLARLSGCVHAAAVYSAVLSVAGDHPTPAEVASLADKLSVPVLNIDDLVRYRTHEELLTRCIDRGPAETRWGSLQCSIWEDLLSGAQHVLMEVDSGDANVIPLVRVHSQCLTGDIFASQRCDCGYQLDAAMKAITESGHGALLYLRQEGRGIGLVAKLQAYCLQDKGRDTVQANEELGYRADAREYGIGAQILKHAGLARIRLLTNNPRKIDGLRAFGVEVVERVALITLPVEANKRYLRTKREKLGHLLDSI